MWQMKDLIGTSGFSGTLGCHTWLTVDQKAFTDMAMNQVNDVWDGEALPGQITCQAHSWLSCCLGMTCAHRI